MAISRDLFTVFGLAVCIGCGGSHGDSEADRLRTMVNDQSLSKSEAEEIRYKQVLEKTRRKHGDEDSRTLSRVHNLASWYHSQGRYVEAEQLHKETLEVRHRRLGDEHSRTLETMNALAAVYISLGRYEEGEQLVMQTLETRRRLLGDQHRSVPEALNRVISLYESWEKPDEVAKWTAELARLEGQVASDNRDRADDEAAATQFELEADQVGIEYIAHSCFRLYAPDGTRILIDPWASRVWVGYDLPKSILTDPVDAVFITHPHYDHDAGEFMGRRVKWPPGAQVIRDPGRYAVGGVQVTGIAGKHAAGHGMEFGQKNTMFVFEIAGLRIAHLGDNEPLSNLAVDALGRVDILMMPIDAQEHLLKHHEVEAMQRAVRPRVLIPMHYRHPDIETDLDTPAHLGTIDPWLARQANVHRLDGHTAVFSTPALPPQTQLVVFRHSPIVKRHMFAKLKTRTASLLPLTASHACHPLQTCVTKSTTECRSSTTAGGSSWSRSTTCPHPCCFKPHVSHLDRCGRSASPRIWWRSWKRLVGGQQTL